MPTTHPKEHTFTFNFINDFEVDRFNSIYNGVSPKSDVTQAQELTNYDLMETN